MTELPLAETTDPMGLLLDIMRQLRDPDSGCPWDLRQDFHTIVPFTIEETYELADAIASGDFPQVCDELGDVLFQVVFYAQMASERRLFDFKTWWRASRKNYCAGIPMCSRGILTSR